MEASPKIFLLSISQKPIFKVGDKVYLSTSGGREGPYVIASVPSTGRCTLCSEDGVAAKNGAVIDMGDVEAA